ncbi:MAG: Mrp/NBP35 family ATP-binding protein [Gammaproteobacteria bacterium]|nr:Mrp/NBP35 family ATP-binding protein [Gammaproteobacteria bacterium]
MHQKEIEKRFLASIDPFTKRAFSPKNLKAVRQVLQKVEIDVELGYPCEGVVGAFIESIQNQLRSSMPDGSIDFKVSTRIEAHAGNKGIKGLPAIKNMIGIASNKGGVGKSTVALNLALALAKNGARVGLLDADVYGPSQPLMLGAQGRAQVENKVLQPKICHGLQTISMGYLIDPTAPMVWRGPMLGKAIEQMLYDTNWDALDYLFIDLPPGTGDIQLTLSQKMPLTGVVMVTTPQQIALGDVVRSCEAFNKLNVALLGIVENMSFYHCPNCGHDDAIFGRNGGQTLAQSQQIPFLGSLPLNALICSAGDQGLPFLIQNPDHAISKQFMEMAIQIAAQIALLPVDYSAKFPHVIIK